MAAYSAPIQKHIRPLAGLHDLAKRRCREGSVWQSDGYVVYAAPATALPNSQHDQHPARLHEWVRTQVPPNAEAVLIGGNGFRAVGAIDALEQDLGRPVLTANSATFWNALRAAGIFAPVAHYGRIFAEPLPAD